MKDLKFIHITKTAGTSIEKLGLTKGYYWGIYDTTYGAFHHYPFTLLPLQKKQKYDWFMVVRNPYERLISELYCHWGGPQPPGTVNDMTTEEKNDFLRNKILDRKNIHNYHFCEQYKYYDCNVSISVLHFENLQKEFDFLMRKYNIDLKLNLHSNKSISTKTFRVEDISEENIKLIHDVYAKDFELFGYEMKKKNLF
jgi:hypothetical protein